MKRMKTLLNIGVLLVSMCALASPSDPTIYQYWLDADQQSRISNTRAYNASSNPLTIDVGTLSEGGHALYYRMATEDEGKVMWGNPVSKYFYVPSAADKSNNMPTAYRLIINNDVVEQGQVSGGSSFTISPTFPENIVLATVSDREFKYKKGTNNVCMTANGTFTYAVQLMSDQKEWGAPFVKEISDQVTTDLPYDSIQIPERYTFNKVNNNNFKAYRFKNNYSDYLYITPSQDCKVSFYYVSDGYQGNLGGIDSYQLQKDKTTRVNTGSLGSDVIAVFYDTPIGKDNSASDIALDIMLEDHQVAKPVIRLDPDTWELTITCPDQRATIFYTLDGSKASTSGTVYTGPVVLDKFTRVRAIAVVGGYDDSEEEDMQYGSAHLRIPVPELKYAGGLDKNEFILTNRVDGVTTYYAFGYNSDLEDEGLRIKFDGKPFKIDDGVFLKAYSVKDNLADSEQFGGYIYLRDYVAQSPSLYDRRSEGEDYEWYSDRKEMINLNVPEGSAYYRVLPGKQTFDPAEEIVKEQWTLYNRDVNDGWIELPGGANSGNQTVQVYAESDDKAPSAVTDIYTNWVRAKAPKIDYNNYKLKLSTDVPGGVIKYNLGYYSPDDAKVYTEEEFPEGIDVKEQWLVTAFVVAEGYENSNAPEINRDRYNLDRPAIEYQEDGYLHIYQNDEGVALNIQMEPAQSYETISENHVRFIPEYNTTVKAFAYKYGRNNSEVTERNPYYQPSINTDGYRVWIDLGWSGDIYYTTDGEKPTKDSNYYQGEFEVDKACTVRAVVFYDGEIPAEAEPAKVLDQTDKPEIIFNYTVQQTEEGPIESKKIKFSCPTNNSKIYYSIGRGLNDESRKLYDPSTEWDGVDVGNNNYVYAYAEAEGLRRSEEIYRELSEGYLSSPNIEVKNDGEVVISHGDPTVTIVPTFFDGKENYYPTDYSYVHDEETNKVTATVRPNTVVKAHTSKLGYFDSSDNERSPYSIPTINVDGYYVWIDNGYGEVFYTLDGSAPTKESKYYEGGFDATPCTVRAVCYADGEIPGEAIPAKVMDPAQSPVAVFNYSTQIVEGEEGTEPEEVTVKKIKFTCPTPNAKIYYSVGRNINDGTKTLYDPETLTDGVDVADYNYVYAYAEAEGYRRSETVSISTGDGYLSVPDIQITDGVVEIWHNDPTVTIVPVFTPAQQYEYVKDGTTNKVTCKVLYNTTVKAHVVKDGCFASEEVERGSLDQPTIEINGNNVYINHYWRDEVYYTLDGSTPTKESQRFDDNWFEVDPCTIKAVAFRDGEIPAESDPAVVLPQVATPKVVYNFDRSKTQRKVKFSCDTQNAKIYYTLNKGITDQNRETYDPSSDGVDVTDISYVYFYAEADGFRRSVESEQYIGDAYLGTPEIMVTGDGVIEIRHSDPSVKIVPTFTAGTETYTPENLVYTQDEETNKITATVKYNTVVKAHVEKEGYYSSDDNQYDPLPQPIINVDGYYVWFDNNYGEIYYTLDGSMPTRKSSYYDGGFNATAGTVRAVCFWEGSIPSEATPASVHAQAETPQVVFNFSRTEVDGEVKDVKKVKFASATPNAKIYYSTDAPLNTNTRKLYDPVANPDGIDVSEISYVYAQATADDYRDSEISERVYMSEGLLNTPDISISNGVVTISHYDPSVTIVPVITPVQEYAYDHNATNNKITFNVAYNSSIKAYVTKTGYLDSDQVSASYVDKPIINVSDYYVDIDTHGYDYYTYYTTDGTLPTTESIPYTGGFESNACTIRAAILIDGYIPMEADQAKVMDPAVTPVIEIDNGFAKISTSTPGATIWYVTDVNISNANRKAYNPAELPNGIDLSSVRTINTYAEAEGYRRSETLNFEKNNFLLSAPSLSYSNGYVSAEVYDDNVAVKFTDGNGKELTPEANNALSVKIPYNTVVNAYTYKKGYLNSSSVQMKCTDAPTITADLFKITIKGKSGQTLHYTTDGSTPTAASKEYEGPFYVTESCKVRAVAFVDNLIPAEGQSIDIAYRKSLKPEVQSYDGRYLTLSAENGSTIKYVKGSDTDIAQGTSAQGKIDLEGINVIKAIAHRDDADDSEVFTFTPEYYANETDVYTSKAGLIKKAFDWCPDKSIYTSLNVHGVVIGSETEDNGDYAFLRALPELRHLDLTDVTDAAIPDSAFASKKLISVVLPTSFKTVGEKLFGEDNTTLCAVEIPGDGFVPETLLEGVKNPNLLLYLKNKNSASELLDKVSDVIKNVVVLGSLNSSNRAENVVLTHANAFYAPKEFNAQKISFTRSFTKETQIGGFGSGWETMVLPFDVQSVSCASKVLKPFGEADTERGECPFWLFRAADVDWDSETSIFANTPYLLAFPNNPLYADEYVVNGDVVFSSNNANVPVTPVEDDMMFGFGMGRYIVGNYETISKEEDVLAINDEVYNYHNTDFQPGGIFVSKQKDVVPFECFVWTESGASGIPVFEQSAIDGVLYETGVKVWSESYDIYIYSGIAMKARIYDSVGQLIRSVDVKAGETVRVQDITPGIYFVGNTKILVKK